MFHLGETQFFSSFLNVSVEIAVMCLPASWAASVKRKEIKNLNEHGFALLGITYSLLFLWSVSDTCT